MKVNDLGHPRPIIKNILHNRKKMYNNTQENKSI